MQFGDLSNEVEPVLAFSVSCFMTISAKGGMKRLAKFLPKFAVDWLEPHAVACTPDTQADSVVQLLSEQYGTVICVDAVPGPLHNAVFKTMERYFPGIKVMLFDEFVDLRAYIRANNIHTFYTSNQDHWSRMRHFPGIRAMFFTDWQRI